MYSTVAENVEMSSMICQTASNIIRFSIVQFEIHRHHSRYRHSYRDRYHRHRRQWYNQRFNDIHIDFI